MNASGNQPNVAIEPSSRPVALLLWGLVTALAVAGAFLGAAG